MAHHYFLMHDPNDFQEIEYLGHNSGVEITI